MSSRLGTFWINIQHADNEPYVQLCKIQTQEKPPLKYIIEKM